MRRLQEFLFASTSIVTSTGLKFSMGNVAQSEIIGEEEAGHLRSFDLRQMLADFVTGCRRRSAVASRAEAHGQEDDAEIGGLLGDVHRAMDLTLPGLLSEVSAEEESRWVEVPDSRDWVRRRSSQATCSRL